VNACVVDPELLDRGGVNRLSAECMRTEVPKGEEFGEGAQKTRSPAVARIADCTAWQHAIFWGG